MKPCKHLDFDQTKYGQAADLVEIPGFSCRVLHWRRKPPFGIPGETPVNVQFCGQGRGRINGIFQCYNEGEMHCYEPEKDEGAAEETRESDEALALADQMERWREEKP